MGGSTDLDSLNRAHVLAILKQQNGNKARAARVLGINRRSLYRLLEKYAEPSPANEHALSPNRLLAFYLVTALSIRGLVVHNGVLSGAAAIRQPLHLSTGQSTSIRCTRNREQFYGEAIQYHSYERGTCKARSRSSILRSEE